MSLPSPYQIVDGKTCVAACRVVKSDINPDGVISKPLWDKWVYNNPDAVLQRGGNGRTALYEFNAIPPIHRDTITAHFGKPNEIHNPLQLFFTINGEVRQKLTTHPLEGGRFLLPEQVDRYTINASVLDALAALEADRIMSQKSRAGRVKNLWPSLTFDVINFNAYLQKKYGQSHTLPKNERRLRETLAEYKEQGYSYLIDGRNNNKNAQVVSPKMLDLWQAIYAGQGSKKPNYTDVYTAYCAFLNGTKTIVNNETGEVYDNKDEDYRSVHERTVMQYQSLWSRRIVAHGLRSGDRQVYMGIYKPSHRLVRPKYAGSIISIDDRQPPFEYAPGQRMWFYLGIDLGSECFTVAVWGDSKEGIIEDFYRQMLRNYTAWGLPLPLELECESSLNSSYANSFLANGAMFTHTRIEANNARGKRIERYFRDLRYGMEKEEDGWIARPFAKSEANQKGSGKVPTLSKEAIVQQSLAIIERWNNQLHSDQKTHPGMTRWQVLMEKQNPNCTAINWPAILPHLGRKTRTSMKAGRITLQGMDRVVGMDGKVALGADLINIMTAIEGEEVDVYWMADDNGDVLKALVYDRAGRMICELLDDLSYSRSISERTADDITRRATMSAYVATVEGFARRERKEVASVTILSNKPVERGAFRMPGLRSYESTASGKVIDETERQEPQKQEEQPSYQRSLADEF